jgi:quercetin dioxygenase-like cupin family protein
MDKEKSKYFFSASDIEKEEMDNGVVRYIYSGEKIQTVEYHFQPNTVFPVHKHDIHEQIGYLIKGKMVLKVGGIEKLLLPGDSYHAPIGVEHNAWTLDEPAVILDIFGPPREDLIKK